MTTKIELHSNGNWINLDLYSEKALNKEEQISSLNQIRENIKNHIIKEGKKDHIYFLDIHLYSDSNNDRLFKLMGTYGNLPNSNRDIVDETIKNRHDYYATGGEIFLAVGGVHPPPPPPQKYLRNTPFSSIFEEMKEGPGSSLLLFA
jgi:hypothetical protein